MSISTYFRPNIHQNGPEILGVNKDKNRGWFLFTFPHPSSNEGNEGVSSPWGFLGLLP
jgi:hypothetical protein